MEIALSWCRGGRRSNSRPCMVLACLRMQSVEIFREAGFQCSWGKWLNCDRRNVGVGCEASLSGFFIVLVRC